MTQMNWVLSSFKDFFFFFLPDPKLYILSTITRDCMSAWGFWTPLSTQTTKYERHRKKSPDLTFPKQPTSWFAFGWFHFHWAHRMHVDCGVNKEPVSNPGSVVHGQCELGQVICLWALMWFIGKWGDCSRSALPQTMATSHRQLLKFKLI